MLNSLMPWSDTVVCNNLRYLKTSRLHNVISGWFNKNGITWWLKKRTNERKIRWVKMSVWLSEWVSKRMNEVINRGLVECWVIVKKSYLKNLSADSRPTVGRLSADSWPTVGRLSADRRPTGFARNIGYLSADSRSTVGNVSVTCR